MLVQGREDGAGGHVDHEDAGRSAPALDIGGELLDGLDNARGVDWFAPGAPGRRNAVWSSTTLSRLKPMRRAAFSNRCAISWAQGPLPFIRVAKSLS